MLQFIRAFARKQIENRPNLLRVIENIGWLFFDKVLRMGVGLILGVSIARYLGPRQFGMLSFANAFISVFTVVAGLGLQGIVVRDILINNTKKEETLGTAAVLQIISGFAVYGIILFTIVFLRQQDSDLKLIIAILGSVVLFKSCDVAVYWFEAEVLSKHILAVQNVSFLFSAAVKIFLITKNEPLIAFAWVTMAEVMVVGVLQVAILRSHGIVVRQLKFNPSRAKRLMMDSWPLLLSGIAVTFNSKMDQIMLGQIVGSEVLGIYSVAVRISEVWYTVPIIIVSSVFPAVYQSKKKSNFQYVRRMQHLYNILVYITAGVAIITTFASTLVINTMFGETFEKSGNILVIHIWTAVFVSLGVSSGKWLIAENLQLLALKRNLYGAAFNFGLNWLLIPRFQAVGAAIASLVSNAIAYYVMDAFDRRTKILFNQKTRALFPFLMLFNKTSYSK